MLTTREIKGVMVCRKPPKGKEYTKDGLPRRGRKIGKVFKTVFDPSGLRVVGFIVRRPDLLWMFKRPEKFLSLDAMDTSEGIIRATKGGASWDDAAIKRCGLDWDKCIIWEGMQVRTTEGEVLGHVDDISFDEESGDIDALFLDDGGTARALIGSVEIPHELMVGYKDDFLVVLPEAAECKLTGGLAAKAGEASARAGIAAKEAGKEAGKAVGKAVDAGSYGLGKGIGRIKNSFTGAVDEFRKEAPAPKKKPASSSAKSGSSTKAKTSSSGAKKASSGSAKSKSTAQSASKAVSNHMKAAGSMFSDFKKEFDKASKGK